MPMKPIEAITIFQYAEAFGEGAKILLGQAKQVNKPTHVRDAAKFAPMCVLDAFATELYLKCLHVLDHGKTARGHDLKKLFEELKIGTQKSVRLFYNTRLDSERIVKHLSTEHPTVQAGLDKVLEMSKTTFEIMRYLYEQEGTGFVHFYWPMLRMSVRDTVLAIHPDWKQLTTE